MNSPGNVRQSGKSCLWTILIILIIFLLFFGADQIYVNYLEQCHDDASVEDCIMELFAEDEETTAETVTATGVLSGTYRGKARSVNISLTIPLGGWAVTGTFEGECDGKITGTYAGGDNGVISGTGGGSCAFIMPASGSFSGTVNKTNKSVFISGTGSAAGISGNGSLTLNY